MNSEEKGTQKLVKEGDMVTTDTRNMMDRLRRNLDGTTDVIEAQRQEFREKNDYLHRHGEVKVTGFDFTLSPYHDQVRDRESSSEELDAARPPPVTNVYPLCMSCTSSPCSCEKQPLTMSDLTWDNISYASGLLTMLGVGTYALLKTAHPLHHY
ncbi:hypothetical protein HDE_11000 [Halotydeus destructor]|nr:hypothetical protein HDE_11000 [Halotydeus destructor]